MLNSALAAPACAGKMPTTAICDSGEMMNGCPKARTSCVQRNWSPPVSALMPKPFMRQEMPNRAIPNPSTSRLSTRFRMNGRNGSSANCGRPSHICTAPI